MGVLSVSARCETVASEGLDTSVSGYSVCYFMAEDIVHALIDAFHVVVPQFPLLAFHASPLSRVKLSALYVHARGSPLQQEDADTAAELMEQN